MKILDLFFNKKPIHGKNLNPIDGLRGLAVLMVMASHSDVFRLKGIGGTGVWMFFILSGFVLALPLATMKFEFMPINGRGGAIIAERIAKFLLIRVKRLLPMYYVSVLLYYFLYPGFINGREELYRHFVFLLANNHFWSTQQEFWFYTCLPFLLIIGNVLSRKTNGHISIVAMFFLILSIALELLLTPEIISLEGGNAFRQFYVGRFTLGISLAYFYAWITGSQKSIQKMESRFVKIIINIISLVSVIVLIGSSKAYSDFLGLTIGNEYFNQKYSFLILMLASISVLVTAVYGSTCLIGKLFNTRLMRAFGVVSYSMYLLHLFILPKLSVMINNLLVLYLSLVTITFIFSVLTYLFIERPFIRIKVNLR